MKMGRAAALPTKEIGSEWRPEAAAGTGRHCAQGSVVQAEAEIEACEGAEAAGSEDRQGEIGMTGKADRIEWIAAALYQDMYNSSWHKLEEWAKPQWRKQAKLAADADDEYFTPLIDVAREFIDSRNSLGRHDSAKLHALENILSAYTTTMSCWKPISTAPKDGTPILAFVPSYFRGKGGQTVAHWMRGSRTPDGAWYDGQAWQIEPTFWQCLPAPPETGE